MSSGTFRQPQPAAQSIADDGDEFNFCSTCAFSAACLAHGYDKSQLRELHVLVEHTEPYREGEYIFREGDRFEAIAAVRSGTVKTYVNDIEGREQVLGFFLPGEVIGLSGISEARYPSNAVALESVILCRFSFSSMAMLATRMPGVQQQLFRLLSQDINKAALLTGNYSADERLAAFLISLSRRYAARGFSPNRFRLTMTRTDVANYLRLASESVSRGLRRLQDVGLVRVERREIELIDRPALESLARSILRD